MKNILTVLVLLSALCFAQTKEPPTQAPAPQPSTNLPQFSISASVMNLSGNGQTAAATDVGAAFQLTNDVFLRADNFVDPTHSLIANFGGFNYALPSKWLSKTKLSPNSFQPYVTASAGIAREGTDPTNRFAALAGGGLNYAPAGNSVFSLNLAEVRWAKLPGLSNSTVIVSTGLQVGWHW